ncbi:MAG TPA: allophanate hydrolase subunit 1 [Nevskiaceae bacterium]|nr:allophanate hydrolase subunit 1 [Nevskiaceae bacterium]
MKLRRAGRDAVLVEVDDRAAVQRLYAELRRRRPEGLVDIVPAARTVLLAGPHAVTVAEALSSWTLPPTLALAGDTVEIPVVYDGEDLALVAQHAGRSIREVVELVGATDFVAAFTGFAPGFAYLTGLPAALHMPRRDSPRPRVPAGSLAIAGEYAGVYPRATPGGWNLLGHTTASLWDADRDPPALIAPGTRVRFVEASP